MAPNQPQMTTFAGVFRPTALAILGGLFYLREGWLVGNAGLLGALAIVLAALTITGSTALSVASVATNVRVRPGGAFGIIASALGLEVGGAISVPLFLAQAASTAMYLYAFTEAWALVFPAHRPAWVALCGFVLVATLAWRSTDLAFRAQGAMLVVVAIAVGSVFLGALHHPWHTPELLGSFEAAGPVACFSIFFPAATGIMVGVSMSGALTDPRRSIPRGTLAAWCVTAAVYLLGVGWYAIIDAPEALVDTRRVLSVEHALSGPAVLLGLMASTLMAALSSLVAASRLLGAMASHGILPFGEILAEEAPDGTPRRALLVALAVAGLGLLSGSLDAIAPLITAFFLMTYLGINLVVLLEQRLGMISFRPTFPPPPLAPVVGVVSAGLGLTLGSPRGAVLGFFVAVALYGLLAGRRLTTPWETLNSGMLFAIAEWASLRVQGARSLRAWRPDLLVPVRDAQDLASLVPLVRGLTEQDGSVKLVGIGRGDQDGRLEEACGGLRARGIYAAWTTTGSTWLDATIGALELSRTDAFPPNLLLVSASGHDDDALQAIADRCRALRVGLVLAVPGPDSVADHRASGEVNVWLSDRSPSWQLELSMTNTDLPVLLGYLLARARGGMLRLLTVVSTAADQVAAERFLSALVDVARMPEGTTTHVRTGVLAEHLRTAPPADLHLFGLPDPVDVRRLSAIRDQVAGPCLFLMDSGEESILA